jgi:hypothetical protein
MPNYVIKNTARDAHTKSLRSRQRLRGYSAKRTLRVGTIKIAPKKKRVISEQAYRMWFPQLEKAAGSGQCEVWECDERNHPIHRVLPLPDAEVQGRPLISRGSPLGAVSTTPAPELKKVEDLDEEFTGDEPEGNPVPPPEDEVKAAGYTDEAAKAISEEEAAKAEADEPPYGDSAPAEEEPVEEPAEKPLLAAVASVEEVEVLERTEADAIADLMSHSKKKLQGILDTGGVKYGKNDNKGDLVQKLIDAGLTDG